MNDIDEALRFAAEWYPTDPDAADALALLADEVERLRAIAPPLDRDRAPTKEMIMSDFMDADVDFWLDTEDVDLALVDWKATARNLQAIVTSVERLCQAAIDAGHDPNEPAITVSDIRAVMHASRYGVS